MGLGEVEKSWLKRLGVLTGKPPFPEEDEKDGGLEESLAEEAAGRRGIAGNGQGEQRIGEAGVGALIALSPGDKHGRSWNWQRGWLFFLSFLFFSLSFLFPPFFYAVWSMF